MRFEDFVEKDGLIVWLIEGLVDRCVYGKYGIGYGRGDGSKGFEHCLPHAWYPIFPGKKQRPVARQPVTDPGLNPCTTQKNNSARGMIRSSTVHEVRGGIGARAEDQLARMVRTRSDYLCISQTCFEKNLWKDVPV